MIHPRFNTLTGSVYWGAQIGPYGAWGDLSWITRWGAGACGMFEASWTMPLPADFDHVALRRGTLVELMDGSWRIGSPLILTEPTKGSGLDDPWRFTATGVGREVEGTNSFYAFDASINTTSVAQTAIDQAIARGLPWGGRDSTVGAGAFGPASTEPLNSIGNLLSSIADYYNVRWGVWDTNLVGFRSDPTTPTYEVVPDVAALGVADDDYATQVYARYISSTTGLYATVGAPSATPSAQSAFGRREVPVDLTDRGPMSTADAQAFADGIYAKYKGRLGWTNGLTLTSNELLTAGGVPADLAKVEAGQMVRLHGVFSDLLAYNGQTWLDIIIGETRYTDGSQTIDINPLGLAARDLAHIVEEIAGPAAA